MKKICLAGWFCFVSFVLPAQDAVKNAGNLQVHSGGSFTAVGNFNNASTAVLINNGSLYMKGNLQNDQAAMTIGSGTLYLNGSTAQSVTGSQPMKAYDLVTNNTAGISLSNDLRVSNSHTFTAGLITTSVTPNYLIYEAGSSYSGATDSRHVNGWVKKIGNTAFVFPVGDANYLRSVSISNLSLSSEFNAKYFSPTPNISNLTLPLRMVKANEYWQLDKISGGSANVGLNWDHSKVRMDNILLADIVAALYSGSWTDYGGTATGSTTGTGNITSTLTSTFGAFTFGYKTYPVPLRLISFMGERRAGYNLLHWTTENEQMMKGFELERSNDAIQFTTIGSQFARNLMSRQYYSYEDHNLGEGILYYRLASIDLDGKKTYSPVISLNSGKSASDYFTLINPANGHLTLINRNAGSGTYHYKLTSFSGAVEMEGSIYISQGDRNVIPLPARIMKGVHMLELTADNIRFTSSVLVK